MNKKQLSEHYYQVLTEAPGKSWLDFIKPFIPSLGTTVKVGAGIGAGYGLSELIGAAKDSGIFNASGTRSNSSGFDSNMSRKAELEKARKSQTKAMQARLKQEMANIRSAGESDEVVIRKKAIENLGKDKDFVAQANQMGYSVGKVSGSESGMFGYRYGSGEEAKKAADASRAQLFDAQGRAKVFERDPSGKLVGRDPTEAEVAARKQPVAPSQTDSGESRATYYGRLAQRGVNIFQEPRSLDQENYRRAAERDIEREGPLDRYKDRGEVMRGMEERGFDVGIGDTRALSGDSARMYSPEYIKSVKDSLGFDPTGMTRDEIKKKALEQAKQKRKEIEDELRKEPGK